ncbi:PREDICTED: F-box/LRR-repeat protein At2g29930-like [Prunus mume]|uniref:F-box/LRR-repeat protein At2g29930-like n=1 Tax=Prunus mume TaxID=102107 RepID=A0ABM1LLE0_PRUMU|nr:PREDICTED: F-box/LRR-repeat protein At2g29930-like [Prunus mume]
MCLEGDKDRISELPDALVCHLLPFLPTTWAARTTVLSRRWNNVWTCVTNLDFNDERDFWCNHGYIKEVSLKTYVRDFARLEGWICTAVRRNVVELDLELYAGNEKEHTFVLPISVLICKTLQVLKLCGSFCSYINYAPPPASGCFPSLKSLEVLRVPYPDKGLMEKLFTNCPVLEHLIIEAVLADDVAYKIQVSAPQLKTLRISLHEQYFMNSVCIDAPKLESLDVETGALLDARSLISANVHLRDNRFQVNRASFAKHATALLAEISNVKNLSLSASHLEAGYLPFFPNLNRLEVVIRHRDHWDLIGVLLDKSPNLEVIFLSGYGTPKCNRKDSELQWDPPKVVP